jgi:hypothetical protein
MYNQLNWEDFCQDILENCNEYSNIEKNNLCYTLENMLNENREKVKIFLEQINNYSKILKIQETMSPNYDKNRLCENVLERQSNHIYHIISDEAILNLERDLTNIKESCRNIYFYYYNYLFDLKIKMNYWKYKILCFEINNNKNITKTMEYGKNQYLHFLNKVNIFSKKIDSIKCDFNYKNFKNNEKYLLYHILYYKDKMQFNYQEKLPRSVIEECKNNIELRKIVNKNRNSFSSNFYPYLFS